METPAAFTPKVVNIVVGISGDGNMIGPGAYCAILKYNEHEKVIIEGYTNTLPLRVTLRGVWSALLALKGSNIVQVYVQNDIAVNAFEKGWVLEWQKKGLLSRKTNKVKQTDLYAKILDAMDGHAVTFAQPNTIESEALMERAKKAAISRKRNGPWTADQGEYDVVDGQLL